ncbi:MAG: M1 family metallopeptidase [Anaerolineales bacterium]
MTQDPTTYSDLEQGKIKHIDFRIRADFSACLLDIEARYQMQTPVSGSLFLDTVKLNIKDAKANGKELEWELGEEDEVVGQRLHLKNLNGADKFTLTFSTSPDSRALQWIDADKTLGGKHPFLFSQCQSIHARSIFPCQDTPSVRFTYSAEVEAPAGLTAVMAAEQLPAKKGSGKFHFQMPQPIPSYLFAIGIAHLVFHEFGPRTGIYAEPEIIEAAAWEFSENEMRVNEAEKLLGPYMWGRYDLLVLPPSFPYGGMENPRLTFLTPTSILGTRGQTSLITHELAHAWTGNLITNATWRDFWLNEGWTTYAETRITEVLDGTDVFNLNDVYNEKGLLKLMERIGMESPHTCLKLPGDEKDSDSFTTAVAYYKGAYFLKECEFAVGRERFDAFIQKYMKRFQFQSIATEDFLDFLKAELPEVFEKVDVHKWVYESGLPERKNRPQSPLFDDVQKVLSEYEQGKRPTKEQVAGWHRYQVLSFLNNLPKNIPVDDCKYFDEILGLEKANDGAFFSPFYTICVTSGYQDVMPQIEKFMGSVGRMLYVLPIFRAMIETEWSKGLVRPLFERVKDRHHPITIKAIEAGLVKAGL